jgi:hypothetical protein
MKAGGDTPGTFTALPSIEQSAIINGLVLAVDNPLLVKIASVAPADGIISLKAGGLLMILDGSIAAGATTNVLVNNVATTGGDDGAGAVGITGLSGGA